MGSHEASRRRVFTGFAEQCRLAWKAVGLKPAMVFAILVLLAVPVAEETPSVAAVRASKAQALLDELRAGLSINQTVQLDVVLYHPLVFAVEPAGGRRDRY